MKFDAWIEHTGPKHIAKILKVEQATVSHWKMGKNFPRPEKLLQIYRMSGGRVSYQEIIHHFINRNKSR